MMSEISLPPTDEVAERALPTDALMPAADGRLDAFFEGIDPVIQDYRLAIRNVRTACRQALDEETIRDAVWEDYPDEQVSGREELRSFSRQLREERNDCGLVIISAKNAAQTLVFTDSEDTKDKVANLRNEYAADLDESTPQSSMAKHSARSWLGVFEAEKKRVELEGTLRNNLLTLIASNSGATELVEHVTSEEFDSDEYRPLLVFLAKQAHDPMETDLVDTAFQIIRKHPELYRDDFVECLDRCYDEDPSVREEARGRIDPISLAWFDAIRKVMRADDLPSLPSQFLVSLNVDDWPESLRLQLEDDHRINIDGLEQKWSAELAPYIDKSTFYISDDDYEQIVRTRTVPEKRTKRQRSAARTGGRVTKRLRPETIIGDLPPESPWVLDRVSDSVIVSGLVQPRETIEIADTDDLETAVRGLSAVRRYLGKIDSDPRIGQDVVSMVISLLAEPRGNGAAKLTQTTIKLDNGNTHERPLPVWRLNPKQRSGLSLGEVAAQTRVFYLLPKGLAQVVLLDVGHKNSYEHLGATSTYRRMG